MRGSKKTVHHAVKRSLPSEPVGESSSLGRSVTATSGGKRLKPDDANTLAASLPPNMLLSTLREMAKDRSRKEEVIQLLVGTLRTQVKAAKHRVSPPHALALLLFVREQPSFFCDTAVVEKLIYLLMMKDLPIPMQSRPRGLQTIAVALLMLAFKDKDDWPEELFKCYLDDSIGELMWVYRQDCYHLVVNLETAFPPHFGDAQQVFANLKPPVALASVPAAPDIDLPSHLLFGGPLDNSWLRPRYDFARPRVRDMLVRMIRETQVRRLSEVALRSFLRVIALAMGFPEVRREVALRIDSWLTLSKLHSHTIALLCILTQNCGKFDEQNDSPLIEALVQRIRLRLLGNIHAAFSEAVQHFIRCGINLPTYSPFTSLESSSPMTSATISSSGAPLSSPSPLHQGNLHRLLSHCVYVTASFSANGFCPCTVSVETSSLNPSGVSTPSTLANNNNNNSFIIVPILMRHATGDAVRHFVSLLLDQLFHLIQTNNSSGVSVETGDEQPDALIATSRIVYIICQCLYRLPSMNLLADIWRSVERGLLRDYVQDQRFMALSTSNKKAFVFTIVHVMVTLQLLNACQVKLKEIISSKRGSQSAEVGSHFSLLNKIRHLTFRWIRRVVVNLLPKTELTFLFNMTKTILCFTNSVSVLLPSEVFADAEMREFARDMVHFVPLSRKLINALLQQGASFSSESPSFLSGTEAVALVSTLLERAARVPEHVAESPVKVASRPEDLIANFFNSAAIQEVVASAESEIAHFADRDCFWKCCLNMSILAAHNPATCGRELWQNYPVVKCMMEMLMTGNFNYPTESVIAAFGTPEKALDHERISGEKDMHIALGMHLISQMCDVDKLPLIRNDPTGLCRKPPIIVLQELDTLSRTLSLGHRLLACREPDYLLELLVAPVATESDATQSRGQSSSTERPWITNLINQAYSLNTLHTLPLQCLAEYLAMQVLIDFSVTTEQRLTDNEAQRNIKKHAVADILRQSVTKDDDVSSKSVSSMLIHSFFARLRSPSATQRMVAKKCLASTLLSEGATETAHLSTIYQKLFTIPALLQDAKALKEGYDSLLHCFLHETDLGRIVDTLQYLGLSCQSTSFPSDLWPALMQAVSQFTLGHPILFNQMFLPKRHPCGSEGVQDSISALCTICLGYLKYCQKLENPAVSSPEIVLVRLGFAEPSFRSVKREEVTFDGTGFLIEDRDLVLSRDVIRSHWLILAHSDSVVSISANAAWMGLFEIWFKGPIETEIRLMPSLQLVAMSSLIDTNLARFMLSSKHVELVLLALKDRDLASVITILKSTSLKNIHKEIAEKIMSLLLQPIDSWPSNALSLVSPQLITGLEMLDKSHFLCKHASHFNELRRKCLGGLHETPMEISPPQVSSAEKASPTGISPSMKIKGVTAWKLLSADALLKKWKASPSEFLKFWQPPDSDNEGNFLEYNLGRQAIIVRLLSPTSLPNLLRFLETLLPLSKYVAKFRDLLLSQPESESILFIFFTTMVSRVSDSDRDTLASVASMVKECFDGNVPLHWNNLFLSVAKLESTTSSQCSQEGISQQYQHLRVTSHKASESDPLDQLKDVNEMIQHLQMSSPKNGNVGLLVDKLSLFGLADQCKFTSTRYQKSKRILTSTALVASTPTRSSWDGVHSLLFSSRTRHQHSEYFMAHLLHHSNTTSLRRCFLALLGKPPKQQHYDASRVLDFLSACLRHPRLFFPVKRTALARRDELDEMHSWTLTEAKYVVDYVILEIEALAEINGPDSELCDQALRQRVHLLDLVMKQDPHEMMRYCEQHRSSFTYRIILCLYAHTPSLLGVMSKPVHTLTPHVALYLHRYEQTALDRVTQYLFSAMRGREGAGGTADTQVNVACRVLAATHPLLFLRYLPLLAALAQSRKDSSRVEAAMTSWADVRSRGYQTMIAHLVQLLRLLSPALFQPQWVRIYQQSLNDLLICMIRFVVRFVNESRMLLSLVGRICLLLEQYRHENPSAYALFATQNETDVTSIQAQCPENYLANYQTALSAGGLLDITSSADDAILSTASTFNLHAHLANLMKTNDVKELILALKEIDSVSKVSVETVPFFLYELEQLVLHEVSEVRSMALAIIRRHLQHRPSYSGCFPTTSIEDHSNILELALNDPNSTAGDSLMKMMSELVLLLPCWGPKLITMSTLRISGQGCLKLIDDVVGSMNLSFIDAPSSQRSSS